MGCLGWCGRVLGLVVFAFVCGRVGVFCGRVEVCLSASCGLLGCCCLCVGLAWCACGATGWCLDCEGVWVKVSSGERGCLGVGCVVAGGVLPVWLRDGVAQGGVSVGFDVGGRVFTLGGVSAPVSGSSPAVSGPVSVSGSVVPVSLDAGVGASGSSGGVGGVRVCVPCAVRVFGESWCSLVLRRWARAAGVGGVRVDALLGSAPGSDSGPVASGSALSSRVSGLSSPSSCSPSSVSGSVSTSSASVSSPGFASSVFVSSRVGAGFGARVCDWGARVGVGGGVVSGGGVVTGWWAGAVGRVRALVSGVGVWGLVGLCGVGVVVLVSVLVCFL